MRIVGGILIAWSLLLAYAWFQPPPNYWLVGWQLFLAGLIAWRVSVR